ncbi:MAG: hypothetical protein N3G75_08390 [Methanothrix sp.]|nr:hypothetical protein [Methanothrix sp.]MCX8207831.1 hypothetical protein [Methanothrix sp.]
MSVITLGNQYDFLRHVITLESIGAVPVIVGRGVVVGIGTSSRGPAMEPYGIAASTPSLIRRTYGDGPLREGLELAAAQGCSIVYGVRVLGEGYQTAELPVVDGQDEPCGKFVARGPGAWGNIPTITISYGDLDGTKKEIFNGNGSGVTTPYALMYDDIVESPLNYVRVDGVTRTIIYSGTPDPGEVLLNKSTGTLTFATGEWPETNEQIEVRYKYKSRKVTIREEGKQPVTYNNLMSLTMMAAKMKNDPVCTFEIDVGATRLPKPISATNMSGGSDGDPITIDDWEAAFNSVLEKLPDTVIPSAVFTTAYEATEGQWDIVALLDQFLWQMGHRKKPCQGFVTLPADATAQQILDFKEGYTNLFLTLISNGYDNTEKDLAGARAGQEAALGLGVSPATASNSLKGVNGLLFQWSEPDRELLTYNGVEVLVKDTGVHPYVGVSTDLDDSFRRTVDVRTICQVIVWVDQIVKYFLNEKRTKTNLARMKTSIDVLLDRLCRASVLDTYDLMVTPNESDHNAVDITLKIQPVGHIERVYTWIGVGYYNVEAIAE